MNLLEALKRKENGQTDDFIICNFAKIHAGNKQIRHLK
jgi:hypothetical protein